MKTKVTFLPQNIELELKPNQSVMDLAHENGIHIKSICKGIPSCVECKVRVTKGEYNVIPPSSKELNLIGTLCFLDNSRLSCQMKCFGDIVVDLSEQIEKAKKVMLPPTGKRKSKNSKAVTGNVILGGKDNYRDLKERKIESEIIKEQINIAKSRLKDKVEPSKAKKTKV